MAEINDLIRFGNDTEHPRQQMQMGGDEPAPPNYEGAAKQTAAGNLEAARVGTNANRVNQYGPGGSIVYARQPGSFDQTGYDAALASARAGGTAAPDINLYGNPDQYQVTTSLSPQQQALYDIKGQTDLSLGNLAFTGVNKAQGLLSNPELDLSGIPKRAINPGQTGQDAIMARMQPVLDRQREALRTQLANQGLGMPTTTDANGNPNGGEAYRNAMFDQNQRENDFYLGAVNSGLNLDTQGRQQGIQEQAFLQDRPLNLINALRTGTQVQGPQFMNVPQQATTQGADYLTAAGNRGTAANNIYNSQVGRQNAMTSGLFDLGASGLQAWGN